MRHLAMQRHNRAEPVHAVLDTSVSLPVRTPSEGPVLGGQAAKFPHLDHVSKLSKGLKWIYGSRHSVSVGN